jgi:hypothetical protein
MLKIRVSVKSDDLAVCRQEYQSLLHKLQHAGNQFQRREPKTTAAHSAAGTVWSYANSFILS